MNTPHSIARSSRPGHVLTQKTNDPSAILGVYRSHYSMRAPHTGHVRPSQKKEVWALYQRRAHVPSAGLDVRSSRSWSLVNCVRDRSGMVRAKQEVECLRCRHFKAKSERKIQSHSLQALVENDVVCAIDLNRASVHMVRGIFPTRAERKTITLVVFQRN